jgi:RND family efflux transporter MFP subunit
MKSLFKIISILVIIGIIISLGMIYFQNKEQKKPANRAQQKRQIPVEAAQIKKGSIELRRTFSGTLEAHAEFIVAPKISGRIERLLIDIADTVPKGMTVAVLDSAEYVQDVAVAEADLEVAKAMLMEAENALEIINRELKRIKTLRERGVKSDSQFDTVKAKQLAKQAELAVAKANLAKAEASLKTAHIRLGYTKVKADWTGDNNQRVVAETFVNEGDTVSANSPLLLVVELNPITGVIYVTEKDYTKLQENQMVTLFTDAYANESFKGRIHRIAPIFRKNMRQARVELLIDNPSKKLKPGMFIRATVILQHVDNADIVPLQALTLRDDQTGLFVIDKKKEKVFWHHVTVGIVENGLAQVIGDNLSGCVVTLGQQLLANESSIIVSTIKSTESFGRKQADNK